MLPNYIAIQEQLVPTNGDQSEDRISTDGDEVEFRQNTETIDNTKFVKYISTARSHCHSRNVVMMKL